METRSPAMSPRWATAKPARAPRGGFGIGNTHQGRLGWAQQHREDAPAPVEHCLGGRPWLCASRAARIFGPAVRLWLSERRPLRWRATIPWAPPRRMGPAYFPTALGGLLAGIGLLILLKSLVSSDGGNVARVHPWLLVRVVVAVAAFAVLLDPLGLVADVRHRGDAGRFGWARVPLRRSAAQRARAGNAVVPAVRVGTQPDHSGLALVPRRRDARSAPWPAGISSAISPSVWPPP